MNKFDLVRNPAAMPERIVALPELNYPERLNATRTLYEAAEAAGWTERIAYFCDGDTWTYGRLIDETRRLAAAFAALAGVSAEPAPAEAKPAAEEPATAIPRFAMKVVVRRQKKGRGGKTATRITGVLTERDAMAAELKKALGCGAVVEGEDIVLLGSLVDRAADWLEARGATRVVRS